MTKIAIQSNLNLITFDVLILIMNIIQYEIQCISYMLPKLKTEKKDLFEFSLNSFVIFYLDLMIKIIISSCYSIYVYI